jgi:hypothetical protein
MRAARNAAVARGVAASALLVEESSALSMASKAALDTGVVVIGGAAGLCGGVSMSSSDRARTVGSLPVAELSGLEGVDGAAIGDGVLVRGRAS